MKAELRTKQFQRLLGPVWWVIEPSLMSVAYYFLTSRVGYSSGSHPFLFIFVATAVWRFFTRCIENSVLTYVGYGYVIRQVALPLLAVNVATLITELIFFACAFAVIILFALGSGLPVGAAYLFLPALVLLQSLLSFALMVILGCVGVYIRDLAPLLTLFLSMFFFFSPAIYDVSKIPPRLLPLQTFNPFFYLFPAYREIILQNKIPAFVPWFSWMLASAALTFFAIKLFAWLRPGFLRVL
jgi:ABC-type polysaccharide/polyol phosphate export permease